MASTVSTIQIVANVERARVAFRQAYELLFPNDAAAAPGNHGQGQGIPQNPQAVPVKLALL